MTKRNGFTILELTITIGMMTILFGAIMAVYLTCFRAYNAGVNHSKARTQLSQAAELITRDLEKAQNITVCNATTLTFYANLGSGAANQTFALSNYNSSTQTYSLIQPSGAVIATGIKPQGYNASWGTTPALFSCSSNNSSSNNNGLVVIDMTAVNYGEIVHIKTSVQPRNMPVGLVGWWQFDEGTVGNNFTTAQDSSGNGYTATFLHTPSWQSGHTGNAILLNGSNQCGTISSSLSVQSTNEITIAGWIYPSSFAGYNSMFFTDSTLAGYWLQTLTAGDVGAGRIRFGAGGVYLNSNSAIPLNAWTHLAGTFDGSNFNIYINGVLDNTISESATINDAGVLKVIGSVYSNCGTQDVYGYLDDIRIYNRALSASEIAQVYNGE